MHLNEGQYAALNAVREGKNVFITGEGGTGKSVVLRTIVSWLEMKSRSVIVCAPTGVAAQNVGGSTIHKVFQFGNGPKVADALENLKVPKAIECADALIIDEVGMVRRDLMDAIAKVVGEVNMKRKSRRHIQVVAVGDFTQLPPVATKSDLDVLTAAYGSDSSSSGFYAFESDGWKSLGFQTCMLSESMRQRDAAFIDMLNRARVADASCLGYFNSFVGREDSPGEDAVRLFGTNRKADELNAKRLQAIHEPVFRFRADIEGSFKEKDAPAPRDLLLKKGARVMLVANLSPNAPNGAIGTVESPSAEDANGKPVVRVRLDSGRTVDVGRKKWDIYAYTVHGTGTMARLEKDVVGSFTQIPLKLAWAITFHKSQGQTLDKAVLDPRAFAPGQLYVGLSRVTSPAGLWLTRGIRPMDLIADDEVISFYDDLGWKRPKPATGDERPALSSAPLLERKRAGDSGQDADTDDSARRLALDKRLSELKAASPDAYGLIKEIAGICESQGISMARWLGTFEEKGF